MNFSLINIVNLSSYLFYMMYLFEKDTSYFLFTFIA